MKKNIYCKNTAQDSDNKKSDFNESMITRDTFEVDLKLFASQYCL